MARWEGGVRARLTQWRRGGQGAFDTMEEGGSGREWHGLKDSLTKNLLNLKYLKDIKTTTTSTIETKDSDDGREEVVVLSWHLPKLMYNNRINDWVIRELSNRDVDAKVFVSWLLYGASVKGSKLDNSAAHAVSRLRKDPAAGAGKGYDDLADLPPEELAYLIDSELNGTAKWRGNKDWNRVMGGVNRDRVKNLADQLGVAIDEGDDR